VVGLGNRVRGSLPAYQPTSLRPLLGRSARLGTPHADCAICAAAEQPREPGKPLDREDAQSVRDRVPAQDLERHDQRVRQQVVVHPAVEHMDRPVVGCRGEQRVRRVEVNTPNRPGVIPVKRIFVLINNKIIIFFFG